MTEREFYNGTVAYNLNGFYLNKRYYDNASWTGTKKSYYYLKADADGNLSSTPATGYYPDAYAYYPLSATTKLYGYVEDRYADGDFIYAGGTIPETVDARLRTEAVNTGNSITNVMTYDPIWPDDYLFFGQKLTYGYDGYDENYQSGHEELPSHIVKSSGRLPLSDQSNRVYRAPAYYGSMDMGVVHFNPWAYLAAKSAKKTPTDENLSPAYPDMTAVDFAGHNDNKWALGTVSDGFPVGSPAFYPPLLDDDGLVGVANNGETPNLLVYAPAETAANEGDYANKKTYDVLTEYFVDEAFSKYGENNTDYYDDGNTYGRVAVANTSSIRGHLVQSSLTTATDHLLIDKQDFNCPIGYTFGSGYRMWYQRTPDNYVTSSWSNDATPKRTTKGWEGVSLPFEAAIVTTQDKGEITHFYKGSATGHEYWLRQFEGGALSSENTGVFEATFNPLAAGKNTKNYLNTFLWDYYYSKDSYQDKNTDEYQKQYYSSDYLADNYPVGNYPYNAAGTPYIVGFPGSTYYEFDLSGTWTPRNRYNNQTIASPGKQTITFASETGAEIGISDTELSNATKNGYTFKPSYKNKEFAAGTTGVYTLKSDGSCYEVIPAAAEGVKPMAVAAFRPYFTVEGSNAARQTRSIVFTNSSDESLEPHANHSDDGPGTLYIGPGRHKIVVSSKLKAKATVQIFNAAGIVVTTFDIEPGETIETQIISRGVYIVRTTDGQHQKKLAVR